MPYDRALLLLAVIIAIVGSIYYLERFRPRRPASENTATITPPLPRAEIQTKASRFTLAHELVNPNGFINSDSVVGANRAPFTLQSLIGKKIILVDFWTYSCINCQRTTPYLNAWYAKYRAEGLEIVGVHTPEFDFEKKYENVAAAVIKLGIKYPVVQDNDYATWSAYRNQYWPHKYLIDIDGYIVYDHIGEGGYAETEAAIQMLLQEKMSRDALVGARDAEQKNLTSGFVTPTGTDTTKAQSPETYFGASRNEYLQNGAPGKTGEQTLSSPKTTPRNALHLAGRWNITAEYALNLGAPANILYRYVAEDVYLVASAERAVRVAVFRDNKPLTADVAGEDITFENGQSYVTIQADRLYKLIKEPRGVGEHLLELIIESPGLKAYTFTFG